MTTRSLSPLDEAIYHYIDEHPEASPQEVLAHFGIEFNREEWRKTLKAIPKTVERLRQSTNPYDRAWTDEPS
jgi:hypothetical protein